MRFFTLVGGVVLCGLSFGSTLVANTSANNGGSPGWAMFFDVSATGTDLNILSMTTFSTATAGGSYSIEVFTRPGSALGGPANSGPGSSPAGWTSLGTAAATQGAVTSGESLSIDIPDISVLAGNTVGVAVQFTGVGPRYFGTGTPPLQNFTDGTLSVLAGDARSAPFTAGGSFFSSRALAGSLTYEAVPEPMTTLGLAALAGLVARKRKSA